jgi:hypothetical protein
MADEELRPVAAEAGVTVAKLREILARARKRYETDVATKKAAREADERMQKRLCYVPSHMRKAVLGMQATIDLLNKADQLETEAYRLIEDDPSSSAAYDKFHESQLILTRHRLFEIIHKGVVSVVLKTLESEKMEEARRRDNVPQYGRAIREGYFAVKKELEAHAYRPRRATPHTWGPGEVYSTEMALNLPHNPRPRRYNDEMEHY